MVKMKLKLNKSYIVLSVLLFIGFITIIILYFHLQTPEPKVVDIYRSDTHMYKDYKLYVNVSNFYVGEDTNDYVSIGLSYQHLKSDNKYWLLLTKKQLNNPQNTSFETKWYNDYFSVCVSDNAGFHLAYYFRYDEIEQNFCDKYLYTQPQTDG